MAIPIERLLKLADEQYPEMQRGIAEVRGLIWTLNSQGEFPRDIIGSLEEVPAYNHEYFVFRPQEGTLLIEGDNVFLTPTESRMLTMLCRNPNRTITRTALLDAIAGGDEALTTDRRTVNVHISHLRKKIKKGRDIKSPIETRNGFGYALVVNPQK